MDQRRARIQFTALGMVTGIIYLTSVIRLPWWRYAGSLHSWRRILSAEGSGPLDYAVALGSVGILMLAYLWGWRLVSTGSVPAKWVWAGAVLFGLAVLWLLPITSDLFIYLGHAHMVTDLEVNPLTTPPVVMASEDRLLQAYLTPYARNPSAYGPAWLLISSPGTLGAHDVVTGVLYLKVLAYASYLISAWLLGRLLSGAGPRSSLEGTYLFAWNPLVILMAVGDGHNDMAMMATVLLSLWLLARRERILSFAVLTVSILVKYVTVVLLPIFVLHVLWAEWARPVTYRAPRVAWYESWAIAAGSRLNALLALLVGSALAMIVVLVPFGSPSWLAAAAQRFLHPSHVSGPASGLLANALVGGIAIFALCYAWLLWRSWHGGLSFWMLADVSFLVLLLAFLLGAARSQAWHLIWPATLVPLSRRRWAVPLVAGLSTLMLVAQIWIEWGAPGLGI